LNISETVRDEGWFQRTTTGNGIWAIKWSRDRRRHVTLRDQTRDPNMRDSLDGTSHTSRVTELNSLTRRAIEL